MEFPIWTRYGGNRPHSSYILYTPCTCTQYMTKANSKYKNEYWYRPNEHWKMWLENIRCTAGQRKSGVFMVHSDNYKHTLTNPYFFTPFYLFAAIAFINLCRFGASLVVASNPKYFISKCWLICDMGSLMNMNKYYYYHILAIKERAHMKYGSFEQSELFRFVHQRVSPSS